jgi:hypothetical protein
MAKGPDMRMTIHTRNPDSFNLIAAKVRVKSLREARARFRAVANALPHIDMWASVSRDRREKNGIEMHHVIDRTCMH